MTRRADIWRDEIDAIYFALSDLPTTLSMFVGTAQNGVLYFLVLRPWIRFLGSTEFALRYLSLIFGVLSMPLFWQLCRKLTPVNTTYSNLHFGHAHRTGIRQIMTELFDWITQGGTPLVAVTLLALNPYHLWYSQEGKMYSLITFLTLLAAWFWLKGIERGGFGPWFGFLITVSMAIYTHLLMILLIPLFLIWFFIAWPQSRRFWRGYLLTLAGLTLPYLPLLSWQWNFLRTEETLTALSFTPLAEILRTVLLYQYNSFYVPRSILYLVPILGLALAGLFSGCRELPNGQESNSLRLGKRRRLLMILAWLGTPVLGIYLLSLRQPIFLPRYVIWIGPAAMMLLALGVQSIWTSRGKLSKPLAVSLVVYIFAYWGVIGWQEKTHEIKTDLRSAVEFLFEHRPLDELLIIQIPHLHIAYQYYSSDQGVNPFENAEKRLGWWAAGLSPSLDLGDEAARSQVDEQMSRLTFGATDIWVMLSEVDLADPALLMLDWLNHEADLIDQVEFHEVQIRQYRKRMVLDKGQVN
jgi:hypothetical protein